MCTCEEVNASAEASPTAGMLLISERLRTVCQRWLDDVKPHSA
eukprot:COSAG02_NODE_55133_length_292_cov_0.803109_1_plen_42_part_10